MHRCDIHRPRYGFVFSLEHIVLAKRVPYTYCLQKSLSHPGIVEEGTYQSQMCQQTRSRSLMARCGLQSLGAHVLNTQSRGMHSGCSNAARLANAATLRIYLPWCHGSTSGSVSLDCGRWSRHEETYNDRLPISVDDLTLGGA